MKSTPDLAFEAIHLVSMLLSRFNAICRECKLVEQELYTLAYIKYQGEEFRNNNQKHLLRQDVTKLLKKVFGSKDTQVSIYVGNLCGNGYLGEITLNTSHRTVMMSSKKGKKALVLTAKGAAKVTAFMTSLEKLRSEVLESDYLVVPGMSEPGLFGSNIVLFLQFMLANRDLTEAEGSIAPSPTSDNEPTPEVLLKSPVDA